MPHWLLVTMISTGSSLPGRERPDQAGGEVALGRAGVAAGDDGDARRRRGASGRCAVPGAIAYCTSIGELTGTTFHLRIAEVAGEVAAARVRVGGGVLHLPQRADRILAHRQQRRRWR